MAPESALRNRGAVGSALESALGGALSVILIEGAPLRALSTALPTAPQFLRALSGALWEALWGFPVLGSLAGRQTRKT